MKKGVLLFVSIFFLFQAAFSYAETADEWKNKGKEYFDAKEFAKAHECFNKALEIEPNNTVSLFYRGTLLLFAGEFDKSIADYDKLIALDSGLAPAYYFRGMAYAQKKNYTKAIEDFSSSIKIDPDVAKVYYSRAVAYLKLNDNSSLRPV